MGMKAVRVRVEGLVQGVWYRAWTTEQAGKLGLDGWVRNRHDGSVEAVFSGPEDQVDAMIEMCRQGSPLSRVESIEVTEETETVESGFSARSTV